jgi:hypothetical protein
MQANSMDVFIDQRGPSSVARRADEPRLMGLRKQGIRPPLKRIDAGS